MYAPRVSAGSYVKPVNTFGSATSEILRLRVALPRGRSQRGGLWHLLGTRGNGMLHP